MSGKSWAVHVYPSELLNETRILRVTKTLTEHRIFDRLLVIGTFGNSSTKTLERVGGRVIFLRVGRLRVQKHVVLKALAICWWNVRVIYIAFKKKPACVNAHSLSSLPASLIIKAISGSCLVYEPHEIETETTETVGMRKRLSKTAERFAMQFVDQLILTSEGHRKWYKHVFPRVKSTTVRNCPPISPHEVNGPEDLDLRKTLGLSSHQMLYLYHGALALPRGVGVILRAFQRLPDEFNILFMGSGPARGEISACAKSRSNIHLLPLVHPSRVRFHAAQADVGIHMMDDSCINHLYALPNKPMEYMNANLPVIVSDVPEMRSLVVSAGSGWIVPVGDDSGLEDLIRNITFADITAKREKSVVWAIRNNWEREEIGLIDCYRNLELT